MAGFREFVTGEILTAANVDDFLAKQVVQKYADAAARDAALGTAVAGGNALREGMVAYLDDTNEVIKYDGSAWSSVAPAQNLVQIVRATDSTSRSTASGTYVDVTGMSVTITPQLATSKIILICTFLLATNAGSQTDNQSNVQITLTDNSTISGSEDVGLRFRETDRSELSVVLMAQHEPGATTATTYKLRQRVAASATLSTVKNNITTGQFYAIEVA